MPFSPVGPILTAAVLAVLLAGCSPTSAAPTDTGADAPTVEEPSSEAPVAPPKSLTWESSCMLSVDEVTTVMQAYNWQPATAPQAMSGAAGDTSCDYAESDPNSIRDVALDFRPYDPVATYGWVSPNFDVSPFAAPDPAAGAQNACATATAAPGSAGYDGICTTVGSVPVVVDPNRLAVVVFPEGNFFYVVQLFGITGGEHEKEPLLAVASLISTRQLVTH